MPLYWLWPVAGSWFLSIKMGFVANVFIGYYRTMVVAFAVLVLATSGAAQWVNVKPAATKTVAK